MRTDPAACGPNGGHQWSKRFGDAANGQYGRSIAVDASGSAVVAGDFFGTMDFGGVPAVEEEEDLEEAEEEE